MINRDFSLDITKAEDGWVVTIRRPNISGHWSPPPPGSVYVVKHDEVLGDRLAAIIVAWHMEGKADDPSEPDIERQRRLLLQQMAAPPWMSQGSIANAAITAAAPASAQAQAVLGQGFVSKLMFWKDRK